MAAGLFTFTISDHPASALPAGANQGLIPFWVTCTMDNTLWTDDIGDSYLLVGPFPDVAYMPNSPAGLFVDVSDMDTGGPTLDIDFGIGASDGTLDYTLIDSGGAGGAASALAATPIATQGAWLDVGGLYIIGDVIAAATTYAAGTIQVGGMYTQNVFGHAATGA